MNEPLEQLKEIRSMMERSSKFLSLSGLSGISAGICALLGAWYVQQNFNPNNSALSGLFIHRGNVGEIVLVALTILLAALLSGIFFTVQKAKKQELSLWNSTSKRLVNSLLIPLITGGVFCIGLLTHGLFWLCFPTTLIFYGLALIAASKYTVNDTFYLGIGEIILGIVSLFLAKYNLIFWAIGFGILHIIYGLVMYFKYDKKGV